MIVVLVRHSWLPWVSALLLIALAACSIAPTARVQPVPSAEGSRGAAKTASRASAVAEQHTVLKGETLYAIAFRHGFDFRDLADWNNIRPPFTIYPGQKLNLRSGLQVPKSLPSNPRPATGSQPNSARPFNRALTQAVRDPSKPLVSTPLATENKPFAQKSPPVWAQSATPPTPVPTATSTLPAASSAVTGVASAPSSVTVSSSNSSSSSPVVAHPDSTGPTLIQNPTPRQAEPSPVTAAAVPKPPADDPRAPNPADSTSVPPLPPAVTVKPNLVVVDPDAPSLKRDGVVWRWPVLGKLITRFVPGDPTQQGLDIVGKAGQTVQAAAAGEVVYSGNGLLGYGELVIVKHSLAYLSAYGHNQRRLVAEGDIVKAGQVIAEVGQRAGQSLLHFEIRKQGKPVDPLLYLPKR